MILSDTTNSLRAMAVGALFALLLAACGGAGPAQTGAPASPAAAATAASAPADPSGVATSAPEAGSSAATSVPEATSQPAGAPATKLNLNEVSGDQLLSAIPNFSSRMVREFQEYRPYVSIQQFRKEIGKYVSAEQVAAYEQYVYVPIDVNQADAATLQQLPGVDAKAAEALIAGRPYASNQAFLDKLSALLPAADLQQAQAYLAAR